MCSLDYDLCPVWRETPRLARKPHSCGSCHATIHPGDAYLDHASVYDGNWHSSKLCFFCWGVREVFAEAHRVFPTPVGLPFDLRNCISEGDEESDAKWAPMLAGILARQAEVSA